MALTLPPEPRKQLLVDKILAELSPADRATLEGWIADPSISCRRIAAALAKDGVQASAAAVQTYRTRHAS